MTTSNRINVTETSLKQENNQDDDVLKEHPDIDTSLEDQSLEDNSFEDHSLIDPPLEDNSLIDRPTAYHINSHNISSNHINSNHINSQQADAPNKNKSNKNHPLQTNGIQLKPDLLSAFGFNGQQNISLFISNGRIVITTNPKHLALMSAIEELQLRQDEIKTDFSMAIQTLSGEI